jgi:prepilin-type N-terminal cleavage/methylation domain-containing protein
MGMEDRQSPVNREERAVSRGERGFSLIEVLIAAGILLVVSLGVLPIFAQAIVNNRAGSDYTQATNYAKSELERLYSLPMDSPDLEITATDTVRVQYFLQAKKEWVTALPGNDVPLWTRTITLRQYSLGGVIDVDKDGALDPPLPAGTPIAFVHLKEIEVQVQSGRAGGPFNTGKRITLRVFKAY